jgi:hypothetical protein
MTTVQPSTSDIPHRARASVAPLAAAALALAAAPLVALALPGPNPSSAQTVLSGGECYTTHAGALNTVKWPDCAGD